MSLLYYFPGREKVDDARISAAGLDYALPPGCTARDVTSGPESQGRGQIAANTADAAHVEYKPDKQTWVKHPDVDVWVGHNSQPTLPEELAHEKQLQGHWVKLADGQKWLCPIIRAWSDEPGNEGFYIAVPRCLRPVAGGAWEYGEPEEKYADLLAYVETWDNLRNGRDDEITTAFLVTTAVALLAVNYRIGPIESYALRLLYDVDGSVPGILDAAIDRPTRLAWEQKKTEEDSAGPALSGGPADATDTIDQP